ncbi:N-acetylmuramate/N-acetylglucosamine kinase [Frankliniella fusca]|uniref:N-acetylmuramate/N-acetylglucosamine kinase n=1 Tax=Frankliniella fusca TaxID=407009 RepID=A0AAE1I4G9_9NEOP|nr:N-acetylmuramate/N-acetylglucosamine kinase [Frankliniella fusca]
MSDGGKHDDLPLKEVKCLSELISAQLADDEELEHFTSKPATRPGENYGSTMLALDIVVSKKAAGGETSRRHLFAFCKMLPDDPERRVIFNVGVTFVKELEMYSLVVPALQQLQLDNGVPEQDLVSHLFPRLYGGRVNLQNSGPVDDDAVILLEDMRKRGFATGDRKTGLNLEQVTLVMEKLAVFHALPVALRRRRPRVYEDTVLRACCDFRMGGDDQEESMPRFRQIILANVKKSAAAKHLAAVEKAMDAAKFSDDLPPIKEPFASILHNDLWTNNVLVQMDGDSPVNVAFIDFQGIRVNSPFKDLAFFLFTSAKKEVTTNHLDAVLDTYLSSFRRCLSQVDVDSTPFTREAAWAELSAVARTELFHILFMLRFLNADPAMIRDDPEGFVFREDLGGESYTRWVENVVTLYVKHGWLD